LSQVGAPTHPAIPTAKLALASCGGNGFSLGLKRRNPLILLIKTEMVREVEYARFCAGRDEIHL
jgi:hypothetical protein